MKSGNNLGKITLFQIMGQNNQKLNQHIEEYLDYYFSLSYPPGFAILLKGEWGCGKTWFINKYRGKLKENKQKCLYVSLYGMTSFSEIENSFFQQLHPILSSKGMAVTGKILQGALKTTLKIDLNSDGKDDGSVGLQIPKIDLPESFKDTDKSILIFDDLERCQIDIGSVLGYINYFVEHQGLKVILVANEDEILKNNESVYKRIKEKLIGKTFNIDRDLHSALKDFIKEASNSKVEIFLSKNIDLIEELYLKAKYENLRSLKQIILDFERIFQSLPEKARNKPEFLKEVLQILMAFSIEIKRGSVLAKDIHKLEKEEADKFFERSMKVILSPNKSNQPIQQSNQIEGKSKNNLRKILDCYPSLNLHSPFPHLAWWQNFLDRGEIDKKELEFSLTRHKCFQDENTPNWIRLWWFSSLKDDELEPLIEKVESEYTSRQFKTLEEVKHITGIFLKLSDIGLYERNKQDILQKSKQYIDWFKNNDLIEINMQWFDTPSFEYKFNSNNGLGFQQKDSDEFKEICTYIDEVRESIKLEMMPQLADDLISTMQNDQFKFYRMICLHVTPDTKKVDEWDQIFFRVPLFKYIAPEKFLENLLKIPHQDWDWIFRGLRNRYKSMSINEELIEEFDWFNSTYNLLMLEAHRRKKKISGYNLKSCTEGYLDEAVENILESLKQQTVKILNYLLSNPVRFISFSQYILSDLLLVFNDWYSDITNSP